MGRRRTVAETIAWRFPSARERPGAGCHLILAPGRKRAYDLPPVGALVSLWKRAPRSVYSVYGEQEYLSGADLDAGEQEPSPAIAYEPSSASRSTRLLGLGLLVGVILSAIALVALNASHPRAPSRRDIGRRASVNQASGTASTLVRPGSLTHAGTHTKADEIPAFRPVRRGREHGERFAARVQTAAPSARAGPTQSTVVESPPARLPRSERSVEVAELIDGEFGFER